MVGFQTLLKMFDSLCRRTAYGKCQSHEPLPEIARTA